MPKESEIEREALTRNFYRLLDDQAERADANAAARQAEVEWGEIAKEQRGRAEKAESALDRARRHHTEDLGIAVKRIEELEAKLKAWEDEESKQLKAVMADRDRMAAQLSEVRAYADRLYEIWGRDSDPARRLFAILDCTQPIDSGERS